MIDVKRALVDLATKPLMNGHASAALPSGVMNFARWAKPTLVKRQSAKHHPHHHAGFRPGHPERVVGSANDDAIPRRAMDLINVRNEVATLQTSDLRLRSSVPLRCIGGPQRRLSSLASDDRSESLPDHDLGTIHHLINDVGDAH